MRAYKFKLYPTKTEENVLYQHLGICRFTYNKLLEKLKIEREKGNKISRCDLSAYLTELKKQEETKFLNNCYSKMLQPNIDRIFSNIRGLAVSKKNGSKIGLLRFKSRNRFSSFTYNQSGFKIIETNKRYNKLHLSKIGDIRIRQHRDIEGNIKQIQVKKKPSGWYAYLVTDGKYECKNLKNNQIGIDLGVLNFLTDSFGSKVDNPSWLNKQLEKIKKWQRKISKSKKGSSNRRKWIQKLLRVFEKIDNQKTDFFHKLTTKLVKQNKLICMEDLNIKSMTEKSDKNKHYNMRNILASSWGMFANMLHIKVSSTESELVFVNPKDTSKKCSCCGKKKNMPLSQRQYNCECGLKLDRDHNSAINILKLGKELASVETEVTKSMKQEAPSFTAV